MASGGAASGKGVAQAPTDAAAARIDSLVTRPPLRMAFHISEVRLRAFATKLGVLGSATAGGTLHALPLVLMVMHAPLPPGWICHHVHDGPLGSLPAGGASAPRQAIPRGTDELPAAADAADDEGLEYVHAASGHATKHHPLLPTLRRFVQAELRRHAGSRYATLTCHEWICVAQQSMTGEPAPVWVNMQTGAKSTEFPDLRAQPRDAVYRRSNGWTDKQRSVAAFYELTTLRQSVGDLPSAAALRSR